jgi:uncharacterized protein (DUF1778 family)
VKTTKKRKGRAALGNMTVAVRMQPATKEALDQAAFLKHMTVSAFIEVAVLDKLKTESALQ